MLGSLHVYLFTGFEARYVIRFQSGQQNSGTLVLNYGNRLQMIADPSMAWQIDTHAGGVGIDDIYTLHAACRHGGL